MTLEHLLPDIVEALNHGGVIAYPTEGVWGLGCLPEDEQAVNRILALKKRHWSKGLILIAAGIDQVSPYLEGLTVEEIEQLRDIWPAPITYLVPDNGTCPRWIKGEFKTVAIRVSDHPVVQALCNAAGSALVSTSANPAEVEPARSEQEARVMFGDGVDHYVPGALGGQSGPSEIRWLRGGEVIRPGS